jgi:hypothetical protein
LKAVTDTFAHASRRRTSPPRPFSREQDLYEPVKRFLEGLGYEVKGEVRGCDVVAVRRHGADGGAEAPIVVELKLAFTLGFVLQGVDRLAVTDLARDQLQVFAPQQAEHRVLLAARRHPPSALARGPACASEVGALRRVHARPNVLVHPSPPCSSLPAKRCLEET